MTRNASGSAFKVNSRLQEILANVVVDFDAEGDDDDDDDDKGGEGEGGEGGEGGQGSSGTDGSSIKDPDKKKLSDEAAKYRKERNEAKKELEAAQTRLRELDDASKSELEKAQRDLTEATAKLETIESRDTVKARKLAFYESGSAGLFKNPKHALALINLDGLELNDDGEYDEAEMKKRADALLKESPYLGADSEGEDGASGAANNGGTGGEPRNPRRKKDQEARDAALRKKFPALSSRAQ